MILQNGNSIFLIDMGRQQHTASLEYEVRSIMCEVRRVEYRPPLSSVDTEFIPLPTYGLQDSSEAGSYKKINAKNFVPYKVDGPKKKSSLKKRGDVPPLRDGGV